MSGSLMYAESGSIFNDIAWRWLKDELETIGDRPQDPFYISEADKKVLREELFPYWEGKSVDEARVKGSLEMLECGKCRGRIICVGLIVPRVKRWRRL